MRKNREDYIENLQILTKNLEGLPQGTAQYKSGDDCNANGTILAFNIFDTNNISICNCFMAKGSCFELHKHETNEYAVIYKGKVKILCSNAYTIKDGVAYDLKPDTILGVGDCAYIPPNTLHSAEALEDTWTIGITVPPDAGYPNDK